MQLMLCVCVKWMFSADEEADVEGDHQRHGNRHTGQHHSPARKKRVIETSVMDGTALLPR